MKFEAKSKASLYVVMSNRGITNATVVDEIIIYLFSCLICSSAEGIEEENKLPNPYKAVLKKIFVRSKKAVIWFLAKKTPVETKTNNKGIRHRTVSLLSGK